MKLKTATYNYIADTNKRQRDGLIAQDVEQALKELGQNFSGLITDDDKDKTLNLSYSDFVLPLINAVQELYKEYSFRVRDSSRIYSGYKDLNDYLCGKRLMQSADLTQQTKQSQTVKQTDRQEQQPAKKKSRGFRM